MTDGMSHGEFVTAYRAGRIKVHVDRAQAARFVSARLLLPFVLVAALGVAVALALAGHLIAGVALFVAALAMRYLVRATSQGFVLFRSLDRAPFYSDAMAAGVLRIEEVEA